MSCRKGVQRKYETVKLTVGKGVCVGDEPTDRGV
jgi:hypothetical protein